MIKKLTKLIIVLLVICSVTSVNVCNAASESRSWYIKRNGNLPPAPPDDYQMMRKYNTYYINDNLCDGEKKLYLTFDAGYENGNVERILNTLDLENIKGAFFVLDHLIIKNTDLVKRMAEGGHYVCNHTKNHKNLSDASREAIMADLTKLEDIYREYTGLEMAKYFRFPEGKYSENALRYVSDMGYKTVFWSFAYADWDNSKQPSADAAMKKILENTHNGAIILLHPTSKTNADILPALIKEWRMMGYEFGTLDELN
jgi:peptidoglycan-N-acetylmuramic acid deacetylase